MPEDRSFERPSVVFPKLIGKEHPTLKDTAQKVSNLYVQTLLNRSEAKLPAQTDTRKTEWKSTLADTGGVAFKEPVANLMQVVERAIQERPAQPTKLFQEFADPIVREFLTDLVVSQTSHKSTESALSVVDNGDELIQPAQELTEYLLSMHPGRNSRGQFFSHFNIDRAIKQWLSDPNFWTKYN